MQSTNIKTRDNTNLRIIVLTALFAALTTVATMFIKIPTLFGYVHVGDSMIYLGASVLPGPFGVIAGAIGGGLSDLFSGYPHWVLPTAIIKAFNAVPFVIAKYIMTKKGKGNKIINPASLTALVPTSLVTVFGYFIAHFLMYDWAAAVAGLTTEWIQPTAGAIIFVALGLGLDGIRFKDRVLR
ncbi:MAG: ECF transporter S component [Ruminococcus sp.]|nr:ECF transporter S component [Ruminococcus sp.]